MSRTTLAIGTPCSATYRRRPSRQRTPQGTPRRSLPPTEVAGRAHRIQKLVLLSHRRWSVPILAELLRGDSVPGGAKFITLANRLKIGRGSLKKALDYLIHHDLVMRNPGYGHPLRPEYILADAGYQVAPGCRRIVARLKNRAALDLAMRKWSIPTVYALGSGLRRFGELKPILKVTSRALAHALQNIVRAKLVHRRVIESHPPSTEYELTLKGRRLFAIVSDI